MTGGGEKLINGTQEIGAFACFRHPACWLCSTRPSERSFPTSDTVGPIPGGTLRFLPRRDHIRPLSEGLADVRMNTIFKGDLSTAKGRAVAWIDSLFIDHAVFRLVWDNFAAVVPGKVYRCNHPTPARLRRLAARYGMNAVTLGGDERIATIIARYRKVWALHEEDRRRHERRHQRGHNRGVVPGQVAVHRRAPPVRIGASSKNEATEADGPAADVLSVIITLLADGYMSRRPGFPAHLSMSLDRPGRTAKAHRARTSRSTTLTRASPSPS